MKEKRLYLVGFMGAGKTTVGKMLAKKNNVPYADLDDVIEQREGKSIAEIFTNASEKGFRVKETEALRNLSNEQIVSCGGGIILKDENVAFMKETGSIIYLKGSAATLAKHLEGDTSRPLLQKDDGEELQDVIQKMMERRAPLYEQCADVVIEIDGKTVETIVSEIEMKL